ncbi:MAG: sulfurtransferase TusA family protein [Nitrososphaeraceae archaeon]
MQQNKIVIKGSYTNVDNLLQTEDSKIERTIDTRGMSCPYPSFESVKAMKSIDTEKEGYCIDIITDSEESALKSIPSVCEKRKWQFVVLEEAPGLWRVRIAK